MKKNKTYRAGNWLRGFFEGEFDSIEQAWSYLSKRFLISFPTDSKNGTRWIGMMVKDINKFGIEQFLNCKEGQTELNKLKRKKVLSKCRKSLYYGI